MTELTASSSRFDDARAQLASFARRNANALVLGCVLGAALFVWLVPAATDGRCMLVERRALGMKAGLSLSFALTALAWYGHKPVLQRVRALRQRFARD